MFQRGRRRLAVNGFTDTVGPSSAPAGDRIEGAAIGEVPGVGLAPAAEHFGQREQRERRESVAVASRRARIARALVVLPRDLLRFRRIEKAKIGVGRRARGLRFSELRRLPPHRIQQHQPEQQRLVQERREEDAPCPEP